MAATGVARLYYLSDDSMRDTFEFSLVYSKIWDFRTAKILNPVLVDQGVDIFDRKVTRFL